jgi:two-component system response regulator FlrC
MSSSSNAPTILWLDPLEPLGVSDHAQLSAAGVTVTCIHTLDDLQTALQHQHAQALAIRHDPTYNLLPSALALFKQVGQSLPLICRVDRRQMNLAVDAMRQGAAYALAIDDYAAATWQTALEAAHAQVKEQALKAISAVVPSYKAQRNQAASAATQSVPTTPPPQRNLVYVDPISRHLLALAQRVAQANVTALIEGPTGAGKEILARVLHESSARANGPFVGLNCAALPEQLIDDMLFGHEKGAFTGAQKDFKGLFEQAQGGTLFLDEIGEMPLHLQAKLLRVLQERQLTRLGAERTVLVDVRVIAATNKDLRTAMASREFREDLYFRISTFKLRVPPLRERPGDILPLVAALLVRHVRDDRQFTVSAEAQTQLLAYSWPGNVRELENVVQRAVVLCSGDCIEAQHLMFDDVSHIDTNELPTALPLSEHAATQQPVHGLPMQDMAHPSFVAQPLVPQQAAANLQAAVKNNEHQLILAAIQSTDSRMEAAKKLGISPRTLRYKLAKLKGEPSMPSLDHAMSSPEHNAYAMAS